MGNTSSSRGSNRRRSSARYEQQQYPLFDSNPAQPPPQHPEIHGNRYVFAASTPFPSSYPPTQHQNLNPNSQPQHFHYQGYHPPSVPAPLSSAYDHRHHHNHHHRSQYPQDNAMSNWAYSGMQQRTNTCHVPNISMPYVEHQKAVTIRNDVNLKKETLHMEPDDQNPGHFLVAFTFDATVAGR